MRKWTMGLLALAGSALVLTPGAMAQSEWGNDYSNWIWNDYEAGTYYTPPVVIVPAPPPAAMAPAPGMYYFSPPAAAPQPQTSTERSGGPGQCGTYMYWSTSQGRCVDARDK
jgi:hypothetical protein